MTKSMLSAKLRFVPAQRFKEVTWKIVSKNRKRPISEIKNIRNLYKGEADAILNYFNREVIDIDDLNI
ncbi:hypothetical protein G1L02_08320 [Tenacibaculum finnmarkense]|nr:hypothetical protein [Tenacibaculum finnmarkense]MBE7646250.1 hypothetical protein [Tenacibaculum finnmarkense genomovar ulcerans]MBE7648307.1 hypothetical protein [Tenacibaculum finnmarkense genomovar ulcerans]MCD8410375.1 hypothetical protein [Tenacibaculum finnmarkense genomovar ulcerans]MCG8236888.1 hypothetical protein [Tenacibaculum finnmarkense genomovar ulcerans]MCG8750468.1 hypothetical protein [Tenacibaculum finnmarkense]